MSKPHFDSRLQRIEKSFDIIVVGGGIHGAALALEASSRGLSTLLLEKDDFASATSANSLKIVHGGIRYLQTMDVRRMRESIKERRTLLKIAPHLTRPLKCLMPTYTGLMKSKWVMWLAMQIYSIIAWDRNSGLCDAQKLPTGGVFSLATLQRIFPNFSAPAVTGGAYWFDAQVQNTERLVLSFIMSAKHQGAQVLNYVKVTNYVAKDSAIKAVDVLDQLDGDKVRIHAQTVVDCRGPWAARDQLLQDVGYVLKTNKLARAINLVVNRNLVDLAFGVKPAPDTVPKGTNRLLFITPWRKGCVIGTWYYMDSGQPEELSLSVSELQDCIDQINSVFPSVKLTASDICNIHLGMLPVDSVSEKTAEPELSGQFSLQQVDDAKGLFVLQGVKFTTARQLAEYTIDNIATFDKRANYSSIYAKVKKSNTRFLPLYGGRIGDLDSFRETQMQVYKALLPKPVIKRLCEQYGDNIKQIMQLASDDNSLLQLIPGTESAILAELIYILENEMVFTLSDLLLRRTDIGSYSQPSEQTLSYCADIMAARFAWNAATKQQQIQGIIRKYSVLNALHQ